MKAIVCNEYGSLNKLTLQDVDNPEPKDRELLLKVLAAGINFPDGLLVQGLYQAKPETPFVPGMEFCGEVIDIGSAVKGFKNGDWIISSSPNYGAFAEQIALPAAMAIKVPNTIDPAQAANLLVAHGTAHHALKQRANLKAGETLVVLGAAGGTYDPVGGDAFDVSVRAMARYGRMLVIGFASGTIPKLPVNLALVKEFSLVGVFWGTFTRKEPMLFADNMQELFGVCYESAG